MTTILLLLIIFMVKLIQRFYKFIYKKKQLIRYKVSPFKKNPIESIFDLILNIILKLGITLVFFIVVGWFVYSFINWGYTLGYDGFVNLVTSFFYNAPFKLLNFLKDSYDFIFDFYIKTCNNAYIYMQPPQEPVYINAAETCPYKLKISKLGRYSLGPLIVLNMSIAIIFYTPWVSDFAILFTAIQGLCDLSQIIIDIEHVNDFNERVDTYNAALLESYEKSLLIYNMQKAAEIPEPMEEFC
jgi:hypothetical protein